MYKNIRLTRTEAMEDAAYFINFYDPDKRHWHRIYNTLRDAALGPMAFENLLGLVGEVHVALTLEYFAKKHPELKIQPANIHGTKTRQYYFESGDLGKVTLYKRHTRKHEITDIDYMAHIDGIPVIFESKMSISKNTIRKAISKIKSDKKGVIKAVTKLYHMKPGYILVIPSAILHKGSQTRKNFEQANGIVAEIYARKEEFVNDVNKFARDYRIQLLD